MTLVHHNYFHHWVQHVAAATLAAAIAHACLRYLRRRVALKERRAFNIWARKIVVVFWLVCVAVPSLALLAFDGPYLFESTIDPQCILVTVDNVQQIRKKYDTFDQFVVTAPAPVQSAPRQSVVVLGMPSMPKPTWYVDVEDTDIADSYRGAAVLVRSSGTKTDETHLALNLQCPGGVPWAAR